MFPSKDFFESRQISKSPTKSIEHSTEKPPVAPLSTEQLPKGCRSITEIPSCYHPIFSSFSHFNAVQSKVFDDVLYTDNPLVISAPTGSGKTVILELAIVRLLMSIENGLQAEQQDFRIIYIAPIKALCSERYQDWVIKFQSLGIRCKEVTGDSDVKDFNELNSWQLIFTTPEKWDSLTRRWREARFAVDSIRLFIIDEVHLLNDETRGAILETIVSRMKTIQLTRRQHRAGSNGVHNMRFVAVSATIPNIEDLAHWLGGGLPVKYYQIPEEMRPVKLTKHVFGYYRPLYSSGFKFDMTLNYKLAAIIQKYSNNRPSLIFCSTRKSTEMAADVLAKSISLVQDNQKRSLLLQIASGLVDTKLKNYVTKGIAFHHAGLTIQDRKIVEDYFRQGKIAVLLSTNTLAMGVNLPAYLVIIKSTQSYVQGAMIELSESSLLQMIGRAGRPQFDTNGVVVIMTQEAKVKNYQQLVSGSTPIESHLHKSLAEHLNAEIVLQTITDIEIAMQWIRSTFLYIRANKNPTQYGIPQGIGKQEIEKKLEEMCLCEIEALEKYELITKDQTYGISITSTAYGKLMARYYLNFETMKLFKDITGGESLSELLHRISGCSEFTDFHLRVKDKQTLNDLNIRNGKDVIRFPIEGKIKMIDQKVNCLLQAQLGNLTIQDPSLMQEATKMMRLADKIAMCIVEYLKISEKYLPNGCFRALKNALIISKCFRVHLWENSKFVSKQLKKIGATYSTLLANNGQTSFEALATSDPRQLEMLLKKQSPFGREIIEAVQMLPIYSVCILKQSATTILVEIEQLNKNFTYESKTVDGVTLIVGDSDNNVLLLNDNIQRLLAEPGSFKRVIHLKSPSALSTSAHLIHQKFVGLDASYTIDRNGFKVTTTEEIIKPKPSISTNQRNKKAAKDTSDTTILPENLIQILHDSLDEPIETTFLNSSDNDDLLMAEADLSILSDSKPESPKKEDNSIALNQSANSVIPKPNLKLKLKPFKMSPKKILKKDSSQKCIKLMKYPIEPKTVQFKIVDAINNIPKNVATKSKSKFVYKTPSTFLQKQRSIHNGVFDFFETFLNTESELDADERNGIFPQTSTPSQMSNKIKSCRNVSDNATIKTFWEIVGVELPESNQLPESTNIVISGMANPTDAQKQVTQCGDDFSELDKQGNNGDLELEKNFIELDNLFAPESESVNRNRIEIAERALPSQTCLLDKLDEINQEFQIPMLNTVEVVQNVDGRIQETSTAEELKIETNHKVIKENYSPSGLMKHKLEDNNDDPLSFLDIYSVEELINMKNKRMKTIKHSNSASEVFETTSSNEFYFDFTTSLTELKTMEDPITENNKFLNDFKNSQLRAQNDLSSFFEEEPQCPKTFSQGVSNQLLSANAAPFPEIEKWLGDSSILLATQKSDNLKFSPTAMRNQLETYHTNHFKSSLSIWDEKKPSNNLIENNFWFETPVLRKEPSLHSNSIFETPECHDSSYGFEMPPFPSFMTQCDDNQYQQNCSVEKNAQHSKTFNEFTNFFSKSLDTQENSVSSDLNKIDNMFQAVKSGQLKGAAFKSNFNGRKFELKRCNSDKQIRERLAEAHKRIFADPNFQIENRRKSLMAIKILDAPLEALGKMEGSVFRELIRSCDDLINKWEAVY